MIFGYERVSTDGQIVAAQVLELKAAGAEKVFREVVRGVQTEACGVQVRFALHPQ